MQLANDGNSGDDSPDLQALFDSIAAEKDSASALGELTAGPEEWPAQHKVFRG